MQIVGVTGFLQKSLVTLIKTDDIMLNSILLFAFTNQFIILHFY